ncbi:type IV pilus assembly protein PilM [Singulisphaera sp. GP187]|uniref:type IV pilus assembly protein PilM n=1 Tax=Singulisphaera sp. GP187 TaxID=1882752 RepID=UPI000926C46C|nr:type IV pilus assembly protein PilM [Singulisphaera sp. GP187]SIN81056.1 type IV pilus assembly protein PilM [Singulisphaera sp. GP187]
MAKIQAVWALDVGQAALKALKLVPGETPDHVVAEAFDYVEYPKILSQPDADPDQLVREALETFLERNDLKGCKVAISVPGQAGLVKFIKLPPVEKKRIPDIVKFEARQQIPFALEEVVWAYQQIGDEDADADEDFTMAEVGLFAMKRDQINRAILPFRVCGIEVDIVQMGPIALYNYITFDQIKEGPPPAFPGAEPAAEGAEGEAGEAKPPAKSGGEKGSIVLIDIGADNTDLIITDGIRIWQRNVPIGGNHFTRALTKELKLTFAKAEHLKRNATKAPDPRSIFTAMRGVFNDFASEINRSIGFYGSVNRNAKIAKVVGLGNGFKLPGLQKFLQQNLSHEVEKLESFIRLAGDDVKTSPQFQENLPSFGVVYGLALQGLSKSPLRTNLLPPRSSRSGSSGPRSRGRWRRRRC